MGKIAMFREIEKGNDLFMLFTIIQYENIPIVFVCTNKVGSYYICLCSEIRRVQRWIISEIVIDDIVKLISQEIDLYSVFYKNSDNLYMAEKKGQEFIVHKKGFNDIDELDLPEKGVMLEYIDDDAFEWVYKLKKSKVDDDYIIQCKTIVQNEFYDLLFSPIVIECPLTPIVVKCVQYVSVKNDNDCMNVNSEINKVSMPALSDFDINARQEPSFLNIEKSKHSIGRAIEDSNKVFAA